MNLTEHHKHALHMAAMAQMGSFEVMVYILEQNSAMAFRNSNILAILVGAYYLNMHQAA
jgi:hypothetical protein